MMRSGRIEKGGAAALVKQKLNDRALHATVVRLNNEYLFGTPQKCQASTDTSGVYRNLISAAPAFPAPVRA
jgi:hypothetical protein